MSFRTVVVEESAKLDYSMGFLVVRNETTRKIHIGEISTLMIASTNISLTSALLAALVKEKVKVIFCDKKRQPSSELIPYYGLHTHIPMHCFWNTCMIVSQMHLESVSYTIETSA